MEFYKRVWWYIFGVGIGVIMVMFLFGSRKDIVFNYFPNARVKGNLLSKHIDYDSITLKKLDALKLDTSNVYMLLKNGSVDFSKSNTKLDSCKTYYIENDKINVVFENCDSIVKILTIGIAL